MKTRMKAQSPQMRAQNANMLTASDPTLSSWVTASAGSGKTHVLVERAARLLLTGVPPERLLCLTYTRAAAAEMRRRLLERLGGWCAMTESELAATLLQCTGQSRREDLARARMLFPLCLEAGDRLRIMTIHAFCQGLLRRFPLEAGAPSRFSVMEREERERRRLFRQLAGLAAKDESLGAALRALAQGGSDDAVRAAIEKAAGDPVPEDAAGLAARLFNLPKGSGEKNPKTLRNDACRNGAFDAPALKTAASALQSHGGKKAGDFAAELSAWLEADIESRTARWDAYCALFLKEGALKSALSGEATRSQILTKAVMANAPLTQQALAAEGERLRTVQETCRNLEAWRHTAALATAAASARALYRREKRSGARLDFADLIEHSVALLESEGGVSWVRFKLDGGIDHILVDEAQDTNPRQWSVIRSLAGDFFSGAGAFEEKARPWRRTVFAVGDEKQCIYAFQGSDPKAFARHREHFGDETPAGGQTWRPVEFTHSFRSSPAILKAVDWTFKETSARKGLMAEDRELRHIAVHDEKPGLVEVWALEEKDSHESGDALDVPSRPQEGQDAQSRLAVGVAGHIHRLRGEGVGCGEVMVLLRRRSDVFHKLLRECKRLGLATANPDRLDINNHIAVMDLRALARFALLPDDDLNLAALLKSPLFGLSEEALFDLAWKRERRRLWHELLLRGREGDDAVFATLAYARRELEGWLAVADRLPPYEFFMRALVEKDGRRRLLARLGEEAAYPLQEFLDAALDYEAANPPSLQGFLHHFDAAAHDVKRDAEQHGDRIRVMTAHGAKGLEARVVILADADDTPSLSRRPGVGAQLYKSGGLWLWGAGETRHTKPYLEARDAAFEGEFDEYRRLLYVAMTRARERLYVAGCARRGGESEGRLSWHGMVCAGLARAVGVGGGIHVQQGGADDRWLWRLATAGFAGHEGRAGGCGKPAPPHRLLPSWVLRRAPPEAVPEVLSPSSLESEAVPYARADSAPAQSRGTSRLRGQVIHALLEAMPRAVDPEAADAEERLLRVARRQSESDGFKSSQLEEMVCESLNVARAPLCAPLFRHDALGEVSILGSMGDATLRGRMDRLALHEGCLWLADFKTGGEFPSRGDAVPSAYRRQIFLYRDALALMWPHRPVRCFLIWTAGPEVRELSS